MRENGLCHIKAAEYVCGKGIGELLGGNVLNAVLRILYGNIVYQDIDMAEFLHGSIHNLLCGILHLQITFDQYAPASRRFYHAHRIIGIRLFTVKGNNNVCTLFCEGDCHGLSDAAVSATDNGGQAIQLAGALVTRILRYGFGIHIFLGTGLHALMLFRKTCGRFDGCLLFVHDIVSSFLLLFVFENGRWTRFWLLFPKGMKICGPCLLNATDLFCWNSRKDGSGSLY